ncbi:MAG: hypothetical protein R3E87_16665 [Burkholderiaceae bacterium]
MRANLCTWLFLGAMTVSMAHAAQPAPKPYPNVGSGGSGGADKAPKVKIRNNGTKGASSSISGSSPVKSSPATSGTKPLPRPSSNVKAEGKGR